MSRHISLFRKSTEIYLHRIDGNHKHMMVVVAVVVAKKKRKILLAVLRKICFRYVYLLFAHSFLYSLWSFVCSSFIPHQIFTNKFSIWEWVDDTHCSLSVHLLFSILTIGGISWALAETLSAPLSVPSHIIRHSISRIMRYAVEVLIILLLLWLIKILIFALRSHKADE